MKMMRLLLMHAASLGQVPSDLTINGAVQSISYAHSGPSETELREKRV
jgi:hypothetical protein